MGKYLGEFLRVSREKASLSQLDISEALGLSSAQYISNIERGISPLSRGMISKAAKILKIDAEDIVDVIVAEYKEKYMKSLGRPSASKKKSKRR